MKILGIDTSCDDTSISLYDSKIGIIFNEKFNQSYLHNKYGGVVPNIASKIHLENIDKLIIKNLNKFNINKIDGIACTYGPGLFGSLLIGTCFSRSLSYSLNIPYYKINHLEGHLFSPLINKKIKLKYIFPFIGLIISGGNTILIKSNEIGNYEILGKTLDDPIGNVIDKIANKLNLSYPGGPEIYKISKYGIKNIFKFPKPMINDKTFNFSFSGIKTHILNLINNLKIINNQTKSNIALELQNSIIDVLIKKTNLALNKFKIKNLLISGGVSSNILIRNRFNYFFKSKNINIIFPDFDFCTDNAVMIAYVCVLNILYNKNYKNKDNNLKILINPKLSI